MTKPWEETWDRDLDHGHIRRHVYLDTAEAGDHPVLIAYPPPITAEMSAWEASGARARLASAAPDMARACLEAEAILRIISNEFQEPPLDQELQQNRDQLTRTLSMLDAALRKAGVR